MEISERGQGLLKWFIYGIVIIAAVLLTISITSGFIMDYYWFKSIGHLNVFMVNLKYQLILLFGGWAIATICLLLAWRETKKSVGNQLPDIGGKIYTIFSVLIGFGVGWWFKGKYMILLKFLNQTSWDLVDPIFGHDVSFYVFTLPMIKVLLTFIIAVSVLVLVFSLLPYGIAKARFESEKMELAFEEYSIWDPFRFLKSPVIIWPIIVLTVAGAISVWLGRYSYLWAFDPGNQVPVGASYMAVHYHIPYTWIKTLGVILIGGLVSYSLLHLEELRDRIEIGDWSSLRKEIFLLLAVFFIFAIIPGLIFGAINSLEVKPNEPDIQKGYLERGIKFTRKAYDLDEIVRVPYELRTENLSPEEALNNPTVKNARIVDYRPIKTTYEERQRLREYYRFPDVDVDRYEVESGKNITVISGREMDITTLQEKGKEGWQYTNLIYTHGYGVVVSPANEVSKDGFPILKVGSIPIKSEWEALEVKEPRIYFGELTNNYIITKAHGLKEFDYPVENQNYYTYEYNRGIKLGSFWKKLITFFYTGDFKILVSDYVGEDSRLLLHRNVHERIRKIAPYLRYDPNAHLFIENKGGLRYLLNGITETERFPYSYSDSKTPGYLSDSVKAFVKTNTGDVEFYIIDENDPLAQTYSKIYPNLFQEEEKMPEDYRKHLIYPQSLFQAQMEIYSRYHMEDYLLFYQKEDLWTPAREKYHQRSQRVEPYNILLDATDIDEFENNEEEFTLVKPFTPRDRNNMRAWVGVGQDPGNYGRMVAFEFPRGSFVNGPMLVEATIDQDPDISSQLTLWGRGGSEVLRGNLLVLPVKNDILYIEPLYLSAEGVPVPKLNKVIAVYRDVAAMENTLEKAITRALGGKVRPTPPEENVGPVENIVMTELSQAVREYLELSARYHKLITENKYGEAGMVKENMFELREKMRKILEENIQQLK